MAVDPIQYKYRGIDHRSTFSVDGMVEVDVDNGQSRVPRCYTGPYRRRSARGQSGDPSPLNQGGGL
jgi:hypothetical protein